MFRGVIQPSICWVLMIFVLTVMNAVNASYHGNYISYSQADYCISRQSCHECIQFPHCAWCSAPEFTGPNRCFTPGRINPGPSPQCPEEFVQNPQNTLTVIRRAELTIGGNGHSHEGGSYSSNSSSNPASSSSDYSLSNILRHETVQLSPQELKLELRRHEPYRISFSYALAKDLPIDVYYLTNFRQAMDNGTNTEINLGKILAESLSNVTSNFRLGFGTTVSLSQSVAGIGNAYGFQNIVSLSQDARTFVDFLHNSTIPHNFTVLDRGPDAIMQAIVRRDEIGWRPDSRKVLVFATDTVFLQNIDEPHGAISPNDELPHLKQDHPTTSQINRQVKGKGINIIWAVTNEQYSIFDRLSSDVEGSIVWRLRNSSVTIPKLIQEYYKSISIPIEIKDTSNSDVEVKYFSSCNLENGTVYETRKCDGLKAGTKVQFFAEIKSTACPSNKFEWRQRFEIYPVGINQSLIIDLRTICNCDCENPSYASYEPQSAMCYGSGALKCGVCDCNDGYFGRRCECSEYPEQYTQYESPCKPDNTTSVECSGRGSCICGHCQCEERLNEEEVISGRFCECDNFSCDRNRGILCSGHGTCQCGQCVCHREWTGPSCACSSSNRTCIAPGTTDGVLCSGHGECICGQCVCQESAGVQYSGIFCEPIGSAADSMSIQNSNLSYGLITEEEIPKLV